MTGSFPFAFTVSERIDFTTNQPDQHDKLPLRRTASSRGPLLIFFIGGQNECATDIGHLRVPLHRDSADQEQWPARDTRCQIEQLG